MTQRTYATDGRKADELCIDARDVRAIEQELTVMDDSINPALEDGEFEIVSESGSTYLVDAFGGTCTCPDCQHNNNHCKHLRRVTFETGMRPLDALLLDQLDVSDQLNGEHVDGEPKVVPPQDSLDTDTETAERAIADGGQRPADCCCVEGHDLPCFMCYNAGFRENVHTGGDDR
ncbi:SWIM zinc finger family protein [Natrinema zhouii]|nr:SWIM zinc finger family protein [Natrinema zhouii]QLK27193.2 SWIM zinc finger family protein [Natrinema zhouii]